MENRNIKLVNKLCYWPALVLSLVLMSSCEDMLIEEPKSVAAEVFYNTREEVEAAVNAIYSPLRDGTMANYIATLECQSDWMYGRGSWDPLSQYQGLNDANITRVAGFWNAFYLAVRNANLVIQNAPNGNAISSEDINKLVGEARFLRALTYFHLVRNWGAIPLRTEENMTEKDLSKSSIEQIYSLIISDLLNAESNLPDVPNAIGRPSKWAAKTLLADVYLQHERFQDAADKAEEVILADKYKLVRVQSGEDLQYKLFGPEILTTSEEIFYLKYSRLANQGNYILWISNHPSTNLFNFGGAYAVHGDQTNPNFINWDNEDLRKSLWDNIDFGLGKNTLVSSKYVDPNAISQNGAGNDLPIYRYAEVLLIYAEASTRASNTVNEKALEGLNQVRRRAYGLNPEVISDLDIESSVAPSEFLDLVVRERGYEFLYEGKRWHELKRINRAAELIQIGKGKTVADKHLLWPIPVSEMNYNKALNPASDQNPGY